MDMFQRILRQLIYMIEHHSKVMVVRIDLHFPIGYVFDPKGEYISLFSEYLTKRLKGMSTDKHRVDPKIYWVCEKTDKSITPHYHLIIMVNGHAIQSVSTIYKACVDTWKTVLKAVYKDGLVHCPTMKSLIFHMEQDDPTMVLDERWCVGDRRYLAMLRLEDTQIYRGEHVRKTVHLLSYLAKAYSKYPYQVYGRSHGGTFIPKSYMPNREKIISRTLGAISKEMLDGVYPVTH